MTTTLTIRLHDEHCEFAIGEATHVAPVGVLTLAILKGAISGVVDEPVSFVNAPVLARERGLVVSETKSAVPTDYVNLVSVRGRTDAGEEVSVAGTLGECLIVNTPGSSGGAVEALEVILPVVPHALDLLAGGRPH